MDFEGLMQQLTNQLKELPGEEAQLKMAPVNRKLLLEEYRENQKNAKQSAVLVIVYPMETSLFTILMLRPSEFGIHSDQISFPGGRFEEVDQNLQETALRETTEELGIDAAGLKVLGALTPVYIPVSNFLVHPFVASCNHRPLLLPNPAEVREVIDTNLKMFLDEKVKGHGQFFSGTKNNIVAPFYKINGYKIWGATAMILSELSHILKRVMIDA
jgi:8-oxo-dGTP pyrophosphatase MutT (NUDIX family)